MKLLAFIEFLRGRLRTVIRVCLAVLAALVVLDAVPGLVHKEGHAHTWVESHVPGLGRVRICGLRGDYSGVEGVRPLGRHETRGLL